MRWITRERVQIDRLAFAWLIRRFVDPQAEFSFVLRGTTASDVTDGIPSNYRAASSRQWRGGRLLKRFSTRTA